ncbi:hypothetical protein RB595_007944 [Gaeumannomyces hyphopodioides]
MSRTILSELSLPNPDIDSSGTKEGANTTSPYWPDASEWLLWRDFNARTLHGLYKDVVDKDWPDVPPPPRSTGFDLEISDEDSFEHGVVSKILLPPVNDALGYARRILNMNSLFDLDVGRSGRCYYDADRRYDPDWALCSRAVTANNGAAHRAYLNLLPGDSKLASKWKSSLYHDDRATWSLPVRQILNYCDKTSTRYGFIITDKELVVFRCAREKVGPGIAATRPVRGSQADLGHSRVGSGETDISILSSKLQSVVFSSAYQPTESGVAFAPVEYQAIPWSNHGDGKKQLTVRLGLFYLAMMAGYGARSIQTEYPAFDSWFYDEKRSTFVHNTLGTKAKKMPPNVVLQHPDPDASGPAFATFNGVDYITRRSVRTLHFDEQREQYAYMDGGDTVYITEETAVYDEESGRLGYFRGLTWVEVKETEGGPSKKRKK